VKCLKILLVVGILIGLFLGSAISVVAVPAPEWVVPSQNVNNGWANPTKA
jgi:hypothetical protein